MTLDEFVSEVRNSSPLAPASAVLELEDELGVALPEDYKEFLVKCNGGYVGGRYWFNENVGVHHIGGFRKESYLSLKWARECYQSPEGLRIPKALLWIMDDPFGNAICLGVSGKYRGKVYFWDHEQEPDPNSWDGSVEAAGNINLVASSFSEFVGGLHARSEGDA